MKLLAVLFVSLIMVILTSTLAVAQISYCKDFLEEENSGGWSGGLQTYEDEWELSLGEEVDLDIWINDIPEPLITSGFLLDYDPATITVMSVTVYELNSIDAQGPWDPDFTTILSEANSPGTLFVMCGNFDPVAPDLSGDILIAKVRLRCEAKGFTSLMLSTLPNNLDTVVGLSGWCYDPDIEPNIIIIQQECIVDEDCDDFTACTDDSCDQITGSCVNYRNDINCDDGVACTDDVCDPVYDCQFIPNDENCTDDGLFCTGVEFCNGVEDCSSTGNPCQQGEFCDEENDVCIISDADNDGIADFHDNCPDHPNGPRQGTCTSGPREKGGDYACTTNEECNPAGFCSLDQEDTYPPDGNNLGDACECEGDFDCDGDVDGSDASLFKIDFGRGPLLDPCTNEPHCNGNFDCDSDCDGSDANLFTQDFGRSSFYNPCPICVIENWCAYE